MNLMEGFLRCSAATDAFSPMLRTHAPIHEKNSLFQQVQWIARPMVAADFPFVFR